MIETDKRTRLLIHHEKPIAFPPINADPNWCSRSGVSTHFFLLRVRNVGRGRATGVQLHVSFIKNLDNGQLLLREDKPAPILRWAHSWWLFTDVGRPLSDAPKCEPLIKTDIPSGSIALCDLGFVIEANGETAALGYEPVVFMLAAEHLPFSPWIGNGNWHLRVNAVADNAPPSRLDLLLRMDSTRASMVPERVFIKPMTVSVRFQSWLKSAL